MRNKRRKERETVEVKTILSRGEQSAENTCKGVDRGQCEKSSGEDERTSCASVPYLLPLLNIPHFCAFPLSCTLLFSGVQYDPSIMRNDYL